MTSDGLLTGDPAAWSRLAVGRSLGVTAATGFTASGVAAGIKDSGTPDLALVVGQPGTVAAGVFTTNAVVAAPVTWSRRLLAAGPGARAVVLNAGNANACTGSQGDEAAARMAAAVAAAIGCGQREVLVCSTGVIGVQLPIERVEAGIALAAAALRADGGDDAATAILTTDTRTKQAGVRLGEVTVAGMAKGAAMLSPALGPPAATMLAVVTTDAIAEPAELRAACAGAAAETFNEITVDLAQSTNDTVLVLASGASGTRLRGDDLRSALHAVFDDLALQMLEDAEGGTKILTVLVGGAGSAEAAATVARRIADAPLVKAAVWGGDPNWGRVLQAAGAAGVAFDPAAARLELRGGDPSGAAADGAGDPIMLFERGMPAQPGEDAAARAAAAMRGARVEFRLDLGGDGPWARVRASDLTPEYVRLNGEYTT
jgi:glutamate N-acetyltransferase/amino-acid N-acetyltransferase